MIPPRFFPIVLLTLTAAAFAQDDEVPNMLTPDEKAGGWKLLFDGKTVTGLQGLQKRDFLKQGWEIKDGALVLPKTVRQSGKATGGDLVTSEQFSDFEFKFDFKLTASALSGVLYFARGGPGQKPTGHEYQIIDDVHNPEGLKGGPLFRTGALLGVLPQKAGMNVLMAERPDEEQWNTGRITVLGNHVEHWLNGEKVLEYDCSSPALSQAVRANKAKVHPLFGSKIKSSLAILDKGEEVAFRNLKIRAISATPPPPLAAPMPPATAPTPAAPAPVVPVKAAWKLPPPPPPPVLK
jgi:Domain of Unknown Function (DUF1080)